MIPQVILLALISSFSTLFIRIIISHRPFFVRNIWHQILASTIAGAFFWVISIFLIIPASSRSEIGWADILCGILIFLCAFWCNYWSTNLAGGFRVQMQINLANQKKPISLKEWMATFGGLGMEVFLKDRIESILIPWNTIAVENGNLRLLPGWGVFFSKLMILLRILFPKVRDE
jgi:hypothetical protein